MEESAKVSTVSMQKNGLKIIPGLRAVVYPVLYGSLGAMSRMKNMLVLSISEAAIRWHGFILVG